MAKKLYVGNLPYSATEEQLRELFSQAGEIADCAVITDRYTGQSKGFAFVEMASDEAAADAISRFDGYNLDNRQIVVNEARPREDRSGGGGGGRGGGGRGGGGGGGGGYGRNDRDRRDSGGGERTRY